MITEHTEEYEDAPKTTLVSVVEAMIFASPEPISAEEICHALLQEDESLEIEPTEIAGIIYKLNAQYSETGRSFSIVHRGRGYTFMTDAQFHPWLQFIQHENTNRKISQSAIETLAIIAYKQPLTKPEIEQIRGVDSSYIVRTLLEKKLIKVAGRRDSPGKPLLYKTSDTFLLHFGINSVEELPKPREIDDILKDDDMAEHRQLLLELRTELEERDDANRAKPTNDSETSSGSQDHSDTESTDSDISNQADTDADESDSVIKRDVSAENDTEESDNDLRTDTPSEDNFSDENSGEDDFR